MKKLMLICMAIIAMITVVIVSNQHVAGTRKIAGQRKKTPQEREAGADKQAGSWFWSRAYPDPEGMNDKYFQGWMHAQAMKNPELKSQSAAPGTRNTLSTTNLFSGNWTAIGPNQNIGGRVLCVAVDPTNSNSVFIGTASGGIWHSRTGGVGTSAWQPISTGLPVLGVASIIIHPVNPSIMYAGTGEVYRVDTSNIGFNVWKARGTYGVGIIKSTDGGNSWRRIYNRSLSNLFGVQMLKFDPVNPDIIYACTTDGLYRTTDAGATFSKILDKIYVSDIAIHPTNPALMLAAVGNLTNSDKGIYRSTNNGQTWTKITTGLPATFEGFTRFDNVAANPNLVVASMGRNASSLNELFLSKDFGATWEVQLNSNHCQYQFWFSHDVALNPSNTTQLLMAGVPVLRYNLTTEAASSIGGIHADIHDIEFDPSNSATVYIACDGGMYKSTNSGGSFSRINGGLQAVQFYAPFAVSPTNPSIMLGGLQDNGVVRYNGSGWTSVLGGDGGPCVFHPTNSNIAFASNDARRLLRSTDGGRSFSEVLSSWAFKADSRTGFMAPVAISQSSPNVVYVGSDNLHRSTNTGISGSWNGNTYTSATRYVEAIHKTAVSLAVSALNPNIIFISTSPFAQYDNDAINLHVNTPPNLFKSTNGGTSFVNVKNNLPDRFVMDFAINPRNHDSVWIVLGGYGTSHVYLSADGGSTWINKGLNLPDVPHNAIMLDPRNPKYIYVGNDLGIYVSPDYGVTWYDFNNGLWDATLVMDLVATSNGKMVAATHGKGAFISDLYTARLPLTLPSFTGIKHDRYNELQWATGMEQNVSHFEVERSIDGINYANIANVAANNNASGSSYSYKDMLSGLGLAENLYYRLRMVDVDGQFTFSNVIILRANTETDLVIANPFTNGLKITFTSKQVQTIKIDLYDVKGRWLMRRIVTVQTGINSLEWNNTQYLTAGNYILQLQAKDFNYTRKLIKKN